MHFYTFQSVKRIGYSMKIYFLSSKPCALYINDAYFGITDGFERFAEASLKDKLFIRFIPENASPIGFFLTENIRFSPPQGCEVYLLRDGIALFARDFAPLDKALKMIAQKRENQTLVTVFSQGEIQASIETPDGLFLATLPPSFSECEIIFACDLVLLKSPTQLAVLTLTGKRVLLESIREFSHENDELFLTLPLCDSLGREAKCTYRLDKDGCQRTAFSLIQAQSDSVLEELLPYAFFESVLLGLDYENLLNDELKAKSGELRAFLGEFVAVIQTKTPNVCALVREKKERLYELSYYTVEIADGKICDIKT